MNTNLLCNMVQAQIGYNFKNIDLLIQAFTRRSYSKENGGENNEVLEFIGDNALDFAVIRLLVEKYGFIDDEKFAKNYFESLSTSKGKRAIANKLKSKGVSNEIVESLLENVEEDDEIEKATALAEKFVKNRQIDAKIKQKCLAHLIYKGYDYSVAQKATNNALQNKGENDDWI